MIQAVNHRFLTKRNNRWKPFPSISLSFACCHQDPPPSSFREFYKKRTDSLELWVDVLQIPLEGFTVQFATLLHSVCNTGNTGRLLRIRQWTRGRGTMKIGQEVWGRLYNFSHYSSSHVVVAGFRALAVTWGEKEERGKWQEIEMEDKHLQRTILALPLAQNYGRPQVLQNYCRTRKAFLPLRGRYTMKLAQQSAPEKA